MNCTSTAIAAILAVTCLSLYNKACADAAPEPASAGIVSQLQEMNDADCATSKSKDWDAFARTLAPTYVLIGADGKREDRAALLAELKAMPGDVKTTACSTSIERVMRSGDRYFLYGTYSEAGTQGAKQSPYRSVERIRDTWEQVNGHWLQTESLAYEMSYWVADRLVAHRLLPDPPP